MVACAYIVRSEEEQPVEAVAAAAASATTEKLDAWMACGFLNDKGALGPFQGAPRIEADQDEGIVGVA